MNFRPFKSLASFFGLSKPHSPIVRRVPAQTRSYPAGSLNRLTLDWTTSSGTGDSEIRYDIESLRARSRALERSDTLMTRYLSCHEKNVLKPGVGFALQNKAINADGTPSVLYNKRIETAWRKWCRPQNCTLNGEESFYDVCRLSLRSRKRDGGLLVRKIIDPKINTFGFTLQLIEIDHLDANYNCDLRNGNRVIMGVEKDPNERTAAYHLLKNHPGDMLMGARVGDRVRIPADQIIHYFVKNRITQCVGVPEASPSMLKMHHLGKYEEAELIASRAAANKGGYFTSDRGDEYKGEPEETQTELGTQKTGTYSDNEPGQYDELPAGMTFVPYDPTHPTQQFADFVTSAKMSAAGGMNLSYASLTGDLTKVSFSSIRQGFLDERQTYRMEQAHMIEHLVLPIFETWLKTAITMQAIDVPMSRFDDVNMPTFRGRKWDWVDPEKDVNAKLAEVAAGIRPLDSVIDESDSDLDLEETFEQIAYEQKLADKLKLKLKIGEVAIGEQEEGETGEPANDEPRLALNGHARPRA